MPAHKPQFVHLSNTSRASHNGSPYPCHVCTIFEVVRIVPRTSELTLAMLRDIQTGLEVSAPRIFVSPYPQIVTILEDHSFFQRFETYDTDPARPTEPGFIALKVDGVPDAKVPVDLIAPAQRHAYEHARAV